MSATKYTYSIQNDFPNHKVSTSRLVQEIQLSAIVIALDRIDTSGDNCDVWFRDALSTGDETILDGLITVHSGEPLPSAPTTEEGAPYVTLLPGVPGRKMCVVGTKFDAATNVSTDNDKTFAETREIQGAGLEVTSHEPGDYVELYVCLPDGTPVGQFGETVYIPPSKKVDQIISEGTVSFPTGFILRMRYVATTTTGDTRTVYAWYRMRK